MIYFDITKAAGSRLHSGLIRMSRRLHREMTVLFDDEIAVVSWHSRKRCFVHAENRKPVHWTPDDWLFTAELFSEEERPGIEGFLRECPSRKAAVFYDNIPLRHPEFTRSRSVGRHPGHLKLLTAFDLVFPISGFSRRDLEGYWRWLGVARMPALATLTLGANFQDIPRQMTDPDAGREKSLLLVAQLEPRKNQELLLETARILREMGQTFSLHLVGRVNSEFGKPVLAEVRKAARAGLPVTYHAAVSDAGLAALYRGASLTLFPSRAEGCGLPILESLWMGLPCICSDIPPHLENAEGGGCVTLSPDDAPGWAREIANLLSDDRRYRELQEAVRARSLPVWSDTAQQIAEGLSAFTAESCSPASDSAASHSSSTTA